MELLFGFNYTCHDIKAYYSSTVQEACFKDRELKAEVKHLEVGSLEGRNGIEWRSKGK